jgi:peptidoglycan-associated lipoprotein
MLAFSCAGRRNAAFVYHSLGMLLNARLSPAALSKRSVSPVDTNGVAGMFGFNNASRITRMAAVFAVALLAAACSQNRNNQNQQGATTLAPGSAQEFVVNVGDRVFFETDSVTLTPTAQGTLQKQAQWLLQYTRYSITIEGHADERGTREYNIALGAKRAQATRDYLVSLGVPGNRLRTISYGKERPVAVCNDISCWSQNRRAVTVLQ